MPVPKELREQILKRDNNRCRNCGSGKDLDIRHIVTREEARWLKVSEDLLEHPHNLITLCKQCHSVTFFGVPYDLLKLEEREELRVIRAKIQKLLLDKQNLKEEYRPNWTALGYIEKRKKLAKSLKECEYRKDEIKKKASIHREKRQKEVLDVIYSSVSGQW